MSAAALALGRAVIAALAEVAPSNDAPAWVRLDAEAKRRGFKNGRAFRAWCHRNQVAVRQPTAKEAWVCPGDVDRIVAGMPCASAPMTQDEHMKQWAARLK